MGGLRREFVEEGETVRSRTRRVECPVDISCFERAEPKGSIRREGTSNGHSMLRTGGALKPYARRHRDKP